VTIRQAVVVGGGLAGMATALALTRQSIAATVLERAPAIAEGGAGIQVTPNGFRALAGLGLAEAARAASLGCEATEPRDALTDRVLARSPIPDPSTWRLFLRRDLLSLLHEAARAGGATVRTGAPVVAVEDGAVVLGAGERLPADLVVGADGIHSVARPALNGPDAALFTGQVAWRAVIAGEGPPVSRLWMGAGRHVVTYPLRGGLLNVVAVREERDWAAEGWDHPDDPDAMRHAFADTGPELRALLARVTEVRKWGLFAHPVAQVWQRGRVALVGDAAHPTLPFLAQGANLSFEDAVTLAACAAGGRLGDYEGLRRGRAERVVAAARGNARLYHMRGPARHAVNLGIRALSLLRPDAVTRRYAWIWDFDAVRSSQPSGR
jgi:salicylate hydroxylase